ncbi:hypothetical protein KPATCC21470_3690 [Kitasatospora purpeofusca]
MRGGRGRLPAPAPQVTEATGSHGSDSEQAVALTGLDGQQEAIRPLHIGGQNTPRVI